MIRKSSYLAQVLVPPSSKREKITKKEKRTDQLMKTSFGAQRISSEDKLGQHFFDYVIEYSTVCNDGHRKKQADVDRERKHAIGVDKQLRKVDEEWDARMRTCLHFQNKALESLPDVFFDAATSLHTQPFPMNLAKPKLTPPVFGYEPAYGMDIPQLRSEESEYPNRVHSFPEVCEDVNSLRGFTLEKIQEWQDALGQVRKTYPYTGPEGEEFELYCALNIRALKRQLLVVDIYDDPDGLGKRMPDSSFAATERQRRGIQDIHVTDEEVILSEELTHPPRSQRPHYHPFRYT